MPFMGSKHGKPAGVPRSKSDTFNNDSSDDETDGTAGGLTPGRSIKAKTKNKKAAMSFFRKQSDQARRRCEHQLYLAQEDPEPVFDISNCELEEVPSNVFPLCKVLQKEVLLLNDNWFKHLPESANILDLRSIRVCDLHNNEIRSLPEELGELTSLQVLNLENNKLRKIPSSIGHLKCLQTLNLKGNKLRMLPDTIYKLKCLRMLDISDNMITMLPKHLCKVRTLETLTLDAGHMAYPEADICCEGTEEIMKYLCSECGMEYLPPSNFLLDILEPPKASCTSPNLESFNKTFKMEEDVFNTVKGYNQVMDKKRQELMEVERVFEEHQQQQAELAAIATRNREKMIDVIAKEELEQEQTLETLSSVKEIDRRKLEQELKDIEDGAERLILQMLDMNAKAKKTEEYLEQQERERIEEDKIFEVRWEEEQNLRKKDVLKAMQNMMQENEMFELVRQNLADNKEDYVHRAIEDDENMATAQVESILYHKDTEQSKLYKRLAKEEQLQRDAFEALQLQKDTTHQRLMGQISVIQEELASLTVLEIERRDFRLEEEITRLAEKRIALIELLMTLSIQRDHRQEELRKRLAEMEDQRLDGQTDYWLVQYQRLMDRKPQSLIDREHQLEIMVVKILQKSEATEYFPLFARHRISIETMLQMTDDDLKQMGVHELGLRKNILRQREQYRTEKVVSLSPAKTPEPGPAPPSPSAPPLQPSLTRQETIRARGMNSECSVCMDNTSDVIFLNCGHVCCCMDCSQLVQECPLCRAEIVSKIKLIPASPFVPS